MAVKGFEKADDPGDMRAGHGCARFGVERDSSLVEILACWACCFTKCSYDVYSRSSDIRLEHEDEHV